MKLNYEATAGNKLQIVKSHHSKKLKVRLSGKVVRATISTEVLFRWAVYMSEKFIGKHVFLQECY